MTIANTDFESMARALQENSEFRVLRRLITPPLIDRTTLPASTGIGVVLDTETTGKDPEDRLIELGMVAFAYNRDTGEVLGILERFNAFEDPGMPIPPEATAVHGITDEMVKGHVIDETAVAAFLADTDVIIAHNAGFDRGYCEKRFPVFTSHRWVCSFRQVPWQTWNVGSAKLEYLAYLHGFFYSAHRAEIDCLALLQILGSCAVSQDKPVLGHLLAALNEVTCRVWAMNSPYETKDVLRLRGYRWNDGTRPGTEKAWSTDIPLSGLEDELAFLKSTIYRNRPITLPVDTIDAFIRFSTRSAPRQTVVR